MRLFYEQIEIITLKFNCYNQRFESIHTTNMKRFHAASVPKKKMKEKSQVNRLTSDTVE